MADDPPKVVLTPAQFAAAMRGIFPPGAQADDAPHSEADALMCALLRGLGYADGVAVFEAADKWYA